MPLIKNKIRSFTIYKWASIISLVLSLIFLFIGISQTISGGSKVDNLQPDFGNLSKEKPVSINLEEAENIGVEYTARTGRRSTTTYNYFVIKTLGKKLILETDDKDEIKKGANINIKDTISPTTAENQTNLKTLANKNNVNPNLKISEQELLDIKLVSHYTDSDKLGSDYWGWIAFVVFLVASIVFGIRFWWDKRNYKIAMEDIRQSSNFGQNINQRNENQRVEIQNPHNQNPNFHQTNNLPNNPRVGPISTSVEPFTNYNSNNNSPQNQQNNQPKPNKTTYILLAVFLGIFGVHHFYNHKILFGFLHLIWLFFFIIPFFAMEQLALIFVLAFILLPITFVVSLIQALMRGLSKE